MEKCVLKVLGPPELIDPAGCSVSIGRKPLALLILLALEGERQPRARLAKMLWPCASAGSARHSLSQALYTIRRSLRTACLSTTSDEIILTQLPSDLDLLARAAGAQRWSEVGTTLSGSFCEDFEIPSAEYGLWLDGCRARVHRQIAALLPALENAGEWNLVLKVTSMLREVLPVEVLRPFELTAERAVASDAPRATFPFVGRGRELKAVRQLQQQRQEEGGGVVVILRGPSGIGKTALGNRITRLSALRGWSCLEARGYVAEENLAYGILDQLLRGLSAPEQTRLNDLVDALFDPAPSDREATRLEASEDSRIRLFNLTADKIGRAAAGRPCMLFIDDYQWADPSSISFLHYFVRTQQAVPHILLLACGLEAADSALRDFREPQVLDLEGLSLEEIEEYLIQSEAVLRHSADSVHRRTGGIPLLVQKVVHQQDEFIGGRSVPVGTTAFFQRQFDRLNQEAQLFLAALSAVGGCSDIPSLAEVAGISIAQATVAQNDLIQQRLLDVSENVLTLSHSLAGDLLLSRLDPLAKRELYARAAKYLANAGGAPPAVVAINLDLANNSTEAFHAANLAAESSIRLAALREAEFFLRLAISHATTDEETASSRMMLCRLFLTLRRVEDAANILSWEGWERLSERTKLRKQVLDAALALEDSATFAQALDYTWECIQRCLDADELPAAVDLLTRITSVAVDLGRQQEARQALEVLVPLLPHIPSNQALRFGVTAASATALVTSVDRATEIVSSLSHAAETPLEQVHYCDALALLQFTAGNLQEAEQNFLLSLQLAERYGIYSVFFPSHNNLGVSYIEMGRYADSERHLMHGLEYSQREPDADRRALIVYDNLAVLEFERGRYQRCLSYVDKSSHINFAVGAPRARHAAITQKGLASLALGRLAAAFECYRELRDVRERGPITSDRSYTETFASRMHQLRGEEEEARRVLQEAIDDLRHTDFFGRARLRLELSKLDSRRDPERALKAARQLEEELIGTGADPLLSRVREQIRTVQV